MYSWAQDPEDEEEENAEFDHGGKNLIIFLVDCTKSMLEPVEGDEENRQALQLGLGCILSTYKSKIFGNDRDSIGVIGFGFTPKKSDCSDFESVRQIVSLDRPSAASILSLEEYIEPSTGHLAFEKKVGVCGDSSDTRLHEALWQAQSAFSSVPGKVGRKTILLLTNNSQPHRGDSALDVQARRKAVDLHNTDIYLDVVPVCGEGDTFELSHFYHTLIKLADEDAPLSVTNVSDLSSSILQKTKTKRSTGHFKFELGHGMTIAVSTYNLLGKVSKPTKQKLASDTNEEIVSSRNWVHPISGAPLLPSDMAKFVNYGGKNIKMTVDEAKAINNLGSEQPALKLVGFKKASSLSLSSHVKAPQFLYPHEVSVVGSRSLFSALLQRCAAREVVAICQFKPRATTKICYVALDPQLGDGDRVSPGFHVVFLPYLDDLRKLPDTPLSVDNPRESVEAAKEIISKLRLKKFVPVENCALQTHFKMIEAHALQKPTMEKLEDETLPDLERMKRKLGDRSEMFLSSVYEEGYNPEAPPKKASQSKVKAPSQTSQEKTGNLDMKAEVAAGSVKKLTVDVLKFWLKSQGVSVTGKKKSDLVQDVMDQFA